MSAVGPVGDWIDNCPRGGVYLRTEAVMFRKCLLGLIAFVGLATNSGCMINQYSSDPNIRMQELLYQSEDLRQIENAWRRFWFNDMPSHLGPERINGGII
jgi:hypothetical protein